MKPIYCGPPKKPLSKLEQEWVWICEDYEEIRNRPGRGFVEERRKLLARKCRLERLLGW
jgi:hypothetical protein